MKIPKDLVSLFLKDHEVQRKKCAAGASSWHPESRNFDHLVQTLKKRAEGDNRKKVEYWYLHTHPLITARALMSYMYSNHENFFQYHFFVDNRDKKEPEIFTFLDSSCGGMIMYSRFNMHRLRVKKLTVEDKKVLQRNNSRELFSHFYGDESLRDENDIITHKIKAFW